MCVVRIKSIKLSLWSVPTLLCNIQRICLSWGSWARPGTRTGVGPWHCHWAWAWPGRWPYRAGLGLACGHGWAERQLQGRGMSPSILQPFPQESPSPLALVCPLGAKPRPSWSRPSGQTLSGGSREGLAQGCGGDLQVTCRGIRDFD